MNNTTNDPMAKDLIALNVRQMPLAKLFHPDTVNGLIVEIKRQAQDFSPDVVTARGRKEIASMAQQVARSKVFLDNKGKDLVSEWKDSAKKVDQQRKLIRDELDELKASVRAPLTQWEDAEKARVAKLETEVENIDMQAVLPGEYTSVQIKAILDKAGDLVIDLNTFEEFFERAVAAKERACISLKEKLADKIKQEENEAELLHLREEAAIRTLKDHEDKIRQDAANRAKAESEHADMLKQQADRLAIERANAEKDAADCRALHAEALARDKLEAEAKARKYAEEAKAKDYNRRQEVLRDIVSDLESFAGIVFEDAEVVSQIIAAGEIRHVTIQF